MTWLRSTSNLRAPTVAALSIAVCSAAMAGSLSIVNPGFEVDVAPATGATGWTITSGGTDWFVADGNQADSSNDPSAAFEGSNWLSGNRLVNGASSSSNPQTIEQLIDISTEAALIDAGSASVDLSFQFSDSDQNDDSTVNISFFSDVAGTSPLGAVLTSNVLEPTAADGVADAPWALRELSGAIPVGTRSMSLELVIQRSAGSAGNTHFDDFRGSIVPEPAATSLISLAIVSLAAAVRRRV
ncbi:hypothetical protein Pla108_37230 [Botrimarina colliarenosi]|uniref:PEP-CTERM protein-sorting domain-containing protein n=1 Tax=Botrimarina colliarenosi TaxID=2528001 RepID=A0A5C6A2C8_9BACT|nr:hypothetical protein [Botrimarina colliarenosi]TWT94012.1 hypothetical protein Pla108_37230 [Botrimarina colliarenosi]